MSVPLIVLSLIASLLLAEIILKGDNVSLETSSHNTEERIEATWAAFCGSLCNRVVLMFLTSLCGHNNEWSTISIKEKLKETVSSQNCAFSTSNKSVLFHKQPEGSYPPSLPFHGGGEAFLSTPHIRGDPAPNSPRRKTVSEKGGNPALISPSKSSGYIQVKNVNFEIFPWRYSSAGSVP